MHLEKESLTTAWLQEQLQGSALLAGERVQEVEATKIGEDQGFMSNVYRLAFVTDSGRRASAVAKLSNAVGASMPAMYAAEVRYYKCLQALKRPLARAPEVYSLSINDDSCECALVLEDMAAPYAAGDQVAGSGVEEAEAAMDALAAFHAQWWHSHPSYGSAGVSYEGESAWKSVARMANVSWTLAEKYIVGEGVAVPAGEGFPGASTAEVVARFGKAATVITEAHELAGATPRTLCHGDFRPDNIMHAPGLPSCPVDYQAVHYGEPTEDLAYYFSGAMEVPLRRAHQERLLRRYHAALLSHGVEDYPWEQLMADFVRDNLFAAFVPIMMGSRLQSDKACDSRSSRSAALSENWLHRGCAAIVDTDAAAAEAAAAALLDAAVALEVPFAEVEEEQRGILTYIANLPATDFATVALEARRRKLQQYVERTKDTGQLDSVASVAQLQLEGAACTLFLPKGAEGPFAEAALWLPCAPVLGGAKLDEMGIRAACNALAMPVLAVASEAVPDVPFSRLVADASAAVAALRAGGVEQVSASPRVYLCAHQEGGAVATALLQTLDEQGLHPPAAVALLSPWLRSSCSSKTFIKYGERYSSCLGPAQCAWVWRQLLSGSDGAFDAVAAVYSLRSPPPPTLAVYAEFDVLCADAEDYVAALESAGGAVEALRGEGWVNNFFYPRFKSFARATERMRQFFDAHR